MAEFTGKKLVRYGSLILLFVVIFGYGIWRGRDLLFGITLHVSGVTDNMTVTAPTLDISGVAENANTISIDQRTIPPTETGSWTDTLALIPGYNVITITATDKFGRATTKEYHIFYNAPALPITVPVAPTPTETPTSSATPSSATATQSIPTTTPAEPATTPETPPAGQATPSTVQ